MDPLMTEKAERGAHEVTPTILVDGSPIDLEDGLQNEDLSQQEKRPSSSTRRRILYGLLALSVYITICIISPYPYAKDGKRFGMFDNTTRPCTPTPQEDPYNNPWGYLVADHIQPTGPMSTRISPKITCVEPLYDPEAHSISEAASSPSDKPWAYLDPKYHVGPFSSKPTGPGSVHNVGASSSLEAAPSPSPRYAYATLLTPNEDNPSEDDIEADPLFVGCRMLAYQLLHAPTTRSAGIPLLVLTTPGTSEAKKARLRLDGATIIEIESIDIPKWMQDENIEDSRWAGQLDKLRLWELEQYDRVLYLDADMIIARPMDALFTSISVQTSLPHLSSYGNLVIAPPEEYLFAAGYEVHHEHQFPPTEADLFRAGYFNAGFFLLMPSREMFDYYTAVLAQPDSFSEIYWPDQSLLNAVHAQDGPMPATVIDPIWNVHFASHADLDAGVHSLHVKWWTPLHEDLRDFCMAMRWRMAGFFELWDVERREESALS